MRLGVLASGDGSNLASLIARANSKLMPAEVAAVASNRPDCGALVIAHRASIPHAAFPLRQFPDAASRDHEMRTFLEANGCGLVVAAGYDRILSGQFVQSLSGRVINIHPSLLPAFAGRMDAISAAIEYGVKVTGVTIHFVEEDVDGGAVIAQEAVAVRCDDDLASLTERIHEVEHRLLAEVITRFAQGHVKRQGRRVVLSDSGGSR